MTPQFKYTLRMRRKSKAHRFSYPQINLKLLELGQGKVIIYLSYS